MSLNDFTKLASQMAIQDRETKDDHENFTVAQAVDALAALADVYVKDKALFDAGFMGSAVPAAERRAGKNKG